MKGQPIAQRLLERIVIAESGCWLWVGAEHGNGYGEISVGGRRRGAHRVAFEEFVRPLEPGEHVCHHCDVKLCINPEHLFAGSHLDNMRDAAAKGIIRATRARGENAPKWLLTDAQVAEIRGRFVAGAWRTAGTGCSARELAAEFGVSSQHIYRIVNLQNRVAA